MSRKDHIGLNIVYQKYEIYLNTTYAFLLQQYR